tara:strand:+ start:5126 stop:5767 length:642 start_codon:yes stop_codon:yes gene_type:complete
MKQLLTLLTIWLFLTSFTPPNGITIKIKEKGRSYLFLINGKRLTGRRTLKEFKEVLGKPDRVVKQHKGKRRCSGLGGMCGTMIRIPKRIYIYYDHLGLELIGTDKRSISNVKIYFDSTGFVQPYGYYDGTILWNDSIFNPKEALNHLVKNGKPNYEDLLGLDVAQCGGKCKLYKTYFRSGAGFKHMQIYFLTSKRSYLSYNEKKEVTSIGFKL